MSEPHSIITVFFLSRAWANSNNGNWEKYILCSNNSEVWIGDDDAYYSAAFTRVVTGMYGSGFHHVESPTSG